MTLYQTLVSPKTLQQLHTIICIYNHSKFSTSHLTMSSVVTSNVYIQVIEDVINKVRDEFVSNGGPGETVLNQLQGVIVI